MSMISAQIDELRQMADGQVTYRDARAVMLEAADTIWQLRDDLQRANAENAKLVDVLHEVETEAVYAYHCLQQDCVTTANSSEHFFKKWWHVECEIDQLKAENAKLRELCKELLDLCYDAYNQEWGWDDDWALAHERAKKLGVDDG